MEALSKQALRILRLFGNKEAKKVFTTVGPEQEYFLIDKHFYYLRPDLINAGRTLFGAKPPKGQELEDQYFGAIPERVLACMADCEAELFKLGVPVKTRHNEVAPSQYEIAPIFEDSNLATDHQMLTMEIMRKTPPKYGLAACSTRSRSPASTARASTTTGRCPPTPARTCSTPATRRTTTPSSWSSAWPSSGPSPSIPSCCACRCAAPPTITASAPTKRRRPSSRSSWAISSRTSSTSSRRAAPKRTKQGGFMEIGVSVLPKLPRDAGDRNRTSPFAFTGNKFEFRAVGGSQSIAGPNTVLNTIVAESLDFIATQPGEGRRPAART